MVRFRGQYTYCMLALYLFCAGLGIPLLALFVFGGNDGGELELESGVDFDADAGMDVEVGSDLDFGGADAGFGDITAFVRRIPVSSYAFFLAFFGGVGSVGTWLDFGFATTLVMAILIGLFGAFVNTAAFAYLRGTSSTSHIENRDLEGKLATVSIPIEDGRRGRVWLETGDERVQLTAASINEAEAITLGEKVLIVGLDNGVAQVMRADKELGE